MTLLGIWLLIGLILSLASFLYVKDSLANVSKTPSDCLTPLVFLLMAGIVVAWPVLFVFIARLHRRR